MSGPNRHRHARHARTFVSRRISSTGRHSGDIILIVCEGQRTEPGYFNGLKECWRLPQFQVEVFGGDRGSAPISVVDYALELRRKRDRNARRGQLPKYDQVWCVLDHEGENKHPTLDAALDKARSNGLKVALSIPAFEFWYVLHFEYTSREFGCASDVVHYLKEGHMPKFNGKEAPFDELVDKIDTAIRNAQRLREHNENSASISPRTDVDLVVNELQNLKPFHP